MSAFSSVAPTLLLLGRRRRPWSQPKRKRGRPRKPQPNWWERDDPPRIDRRRTAGDTASVVDLVDDWKKANAPREQRRPFSDPEALAHLLYENAPAAVRKGKLDRRILEDLNAHLRALQRNAETHWQHRRALPKAVEQVEGERLAWWVKRLSYHRTQLAANAGVNGRKRRRPGSRR